jgi:hypothetical protein
MEDQMKFQLLLEDFFELIIEEVPISSFLCIYELHTHEKNYLLDLKNFLIREENFLYNSSSLGAPEAIIKLTKEAKDILLNFSKKDSILSDLIHFSIYYNEELLVESFDNLVNTGINKKILKDNVKWERFKKKKLMSEI